MTTLEAQQEVITNLILENKKLKQERDEAREDLEFRRGLYKLQEEYLEDARRERDEARGAIKSTIAWLKERRNAPDFTTMGMVEERLLKALEAAK